MRRRNARLVGRHWLGSAFATKAGSLDQFRYSTSWTASITAQPNIPHRAKFICNAIPIARLPIAYFSTPGSFYGLQLAERLGPIQGCALQDNKDRFERPGQPTKKESEMSDDQTFGRKVLTPAQREARKVFRAAEAKKALSDHEKAQKAFDENRERLKTERLVREAEALKAKK